MILPPRAQARADFRAQKSSADGSKTDESTTTKRAHQRIAGGQHRRTGPRGVCLLRHPPTRPRLQISGLPRQQRSETAASWWGTHEQPKQGKKAKQRRTRKPKIKHVDPIHPLEEEGNALSRNKRKKTQKRKYLPRKGWATAEKAYTIE